MVASLKVIDRGLVWVLRELGLKVKEEERFERKMEEDEGGVECCHFYTEREIFLIFFFLINVFQFFEIKKFFIKKSKMALF